MKVIVRPAVQEDAEAMCQVINPLIEEGNSTARSWPLDSTRMLRDVIATPSGLSCCVAVLTKKYWVFKASVLSSPLLHKVLLGAGGL